MADAPPAIPTQFQLVDPNDRAWQLGYTYTWTSAIALFTLISLPKLYLSSKNGNLWQQFRGISQTASPVLYEPIREDDRLLEKASPRRRSRWSALSWLPNLLLWKPFSFGLDAGQMVLVVVYISVVLFCALYKAPLYDRPNRPGYMAVAQLPFVFLFATKNSILSLLWSRGYEKLNFIHRWAGRSIFVLAAIHGSFWIRNHTKAGTGVLNQEKDRLGVTTFITLGILVLSSLKPVRRLAYDVFFGMHVLAFVTFVTVLNYHTPYALPWIIPSVTIYGIDLLLRLLRFRVKEAYLSAPNAQMTIIHVQDCDIGWVAGQHVRLRTFSGRVFESHPVTIMNSPSPASCLTQGSLILGVRACGDWSKSMSKCCSTTGDKEQETKMMVMLDGPYGGCSIDIGRYERLLLIAGGSGVTFTLALLDDIVGRVARMGRRNNEQTQTILFAWCIRSWGNILWIAPYLSEIAKVAQNSSIRLEISIFVTCLCDPEAVPVIPNTTVVMEKPSIRKLVEKLLPSDGVGGGGFALAASGPQELATEARNTIASLSSSDRRRFGEVNIHTEVFDI